jgi:prepilin signal peptidase PulO-like enzyme (type II secretory pathway)
MRVIPALNPFAAPTDIEAAAIPSYTPIGRGVCPVCGTELKETVVWRFFVPFRFSCRNCKSKLLARAPRLWMFALFNPLEWGLCYYGMSLVWPRFLLGLFVAGGMGLLNGVSNRVTFWYIRRYAVISPRDPR